MGRVFTLDSGDWYKADVTNIVSMWVSGEKVNRGFELRDDTESGTDHWSSLYSSDASSSNNPILIINYTPYYGSRPYQQATSTSHVPNCFGYAIELKQDIQLDGIDRNEMKGMTKNQMLTYMANLAQNRMNALIHSQNYASISSYVSEINTGWFRIVFRVGFIDLDGDDKYDTDEEYDFHLWYQTNQNGGQWAQLFINGGSSRISGSAGVNPTSLINAWKHNGLTGEIVYNSDAKYYQIKDIRTIQW